MLTRSVSGLGRAQTKLRPRRKRQRYGELVPLAAQIADRSEKTIYAVLKGEYRSARCEAAIEMARAEIRELGRVA